jgi:hypothetical protein
MRIVIALLAFLVTWEVGHSIPIACNHPGYSDGYGNWKPYGCLVNHSRYEWESCFRKFETREEAEEFVEKAPSNTRHFIIEELKDK